MKSVINRGSRGSVRRLYTAETFHPSHIRGSDISKHINRDLILNFDSSIMLLFNGKLNTIVIKSVDIVPKLTYSTRVVWCFEFLD